jgi:TIR domain
METESKRSLSTYLSYAQKDEALKQEFEDYLAILQQARFISGWVARQVQPGMDWSQEVDPRLLTANLILLLVSVDLLSSGYCSGAEVRKALENHQAKKAFVIPIILRRVDLTGQLIGKLQTLPGDDKEFWKPVTAWSDRDEAWWKVDQGIRRVIIMLTR